MLFDNLAACLSPLVPEELRKIWSSASSVPFNPGANCNFVLACRLSPTRYQEGKSGRQYMRPCMIFTDGPDKVGHMDSVNANVLRPLGFYMWSMNRQIAPLANLSEPETQLPLAAVPQKLSLKRKNDGLIFDGEVLLDVKKRRVTRKSPRNSKDAYLNALTLENESGVDRVEVMKEPKDPMASLLIKKRGNVRFQLPKARTKAIRARCSVIDLPGQKDLGTLALDNSTFAITGPLPEAKNSPWLSAFSDRSWDNSDGNEDSGQSTLVPTPSGSIEYTQGRTNTWIDNNRGSSSSAGLSKSLNSMLLPVSDSDESHRKIESKEGYEINSGSDVYSGSEEEEEQSWAAISSQGEVERQLEVVSDSESSERGRKALACKGNRSVLQTNGRAVEQSHRTHIRDQSPGNCVRNLVHSEDGNGRLLKVSIKTLLDIGSGSFQGTLLKPKMAYRGKEINFLRRA